MFDLMGAGGRGRVRVLRRERAKGEGRRVLRVQFHETWKARTGEAERALNH